MFVAELERTVVNVPRSDLPEDVSQGDALGPARSVDREETNQRGRRSEQRSNAYGNSFVFPIFEVAGLKGPVLDGKEVVPGAAVRVWKGYEVRS